MSRYRLGNNTIHVHWTEESPLVFQFLERVFGAAPEPIDTADAKVGKHTVEIKSCREWNQAPGANGYRRRGRFMFNGNEQADYILFVLVHPDRNLSFALHDAKEFPLGTRFQIPFRRIF